MNYKLSGGIKMAKYNLKCVDCSNKYTVEVIKDKTPQLACPKCKSDNIKADYEQPEIKPKFESDNFKCYCALK
ncbi:MAG: hypothetical protein PWP71_1459 [Clostridia bacterium]|jgi:Zn finger protein HypA/HybF involved in hydrogenase expression|nr:hypothetical protein [Clostridia bacterium]